VVDEVEVGVRVGGLRMISGGGGVRGGGIRDFQALSRSCSSHHMASS
jgi:hypothetical protein